MPFTKDFAFFDIGATHVGSQPFNYFDGSTTELSATTTTSRTQAGVSRIQVSAVPTTQSGVSRLQSNGSAQTQSGTSRLTSTETATQSGTARICTTSSQTQSGTATVWLPGIAIIAGTARIQVTSPQTATGIVRIQAASSQIQTGGSRLQLTSSGTQTGQSRIYGTVRWSQTGVGRIQLTAPVKTLDRTARLQSTSAQTQSSLSNIRATKLQTQAGVVSVVKRKQQTQSAVSNIILGLYQGAFRGRNDDGNETSATWKASLSVNWTQTSGIVFRVRFVINSLYDSYGSWEQITPYLQYKLNGSAWTNVTATSAVVQASPSAYVSDKTATTNLLGYSDIGVYRTGSIDTDNGALESSISLGLRDYTEVEYCVKILGTDISDGDLLQLRVYDRAIGTWSAVVPQITVSKISPIATISGRSNIRNTVIHNQLGAAHIAHVATQNGTARIQRARVLNTQPAKGNIRATTTKTHAGISHISHAVSQTGTATIQNSTNYLHFIGAGLPGASPTLPTGWLPGDILFAYVALVPVAGNYNPSIDAPLGWNVLDSGTKNGSSDASDFVCTGCYWKVAQVGDIAPLITTHGATSTVCQILAYRGGSTLDVAGAVVVEATDLTYIGAGSLTTSAARDTVLWVGAAVDGVYYPCNFDFLIESPWIIRCSVPTWGTQPNGTLPAYLSIFIADTVVPTPTSTDSALAVVGGTPNHTNSQLIAFRSATWRQQTGTATIKPVQPQVGISRIQGTSQATISGTAKIRLQQTQTGVAAIVLRTYQSIVGTATLLHRTNQGISGTASISGTTAQAQTGTALIFGCNQIPGVSRIQNTVPAVNISGQSRIQRNGGQRTLSGLSRLRVTTQRTRAGISNIRITSSAAQTATSRIYATGVQKTQVGAASLLETTIQTQSGTANIYNTLYLQVGTARVQQTVSANTSGSAYIKSLVHYVGAGTRGGVHPTYPADWQADDLLICQIAVNTSYNDGTTITMPAGWTTINRGKGSDDGSVRCATFYRLAQDGDSTPTITVSTGKATISQIIAYRGCSKTTPIEVIGTLNPGPVPGNITAPGVRTVADNELVVFLGCAASPGTYQYSATFTYDSLTPSLIERIDQPNGNGGVQMGIPGICIADCGIATGGTSTGNRIAYPSAFVQGVAQMIVLRPVLTTKHDMPGRADIQNTTLRPSIGQARIQKTAPPQSATGHAWVNWRFQVSSQGLSRIYATVQQQVAGTARIQVLAVKQTQSALSRIQWSDEKATLAGTARITATSVCPLQGTSRIRTTVQRTSTGIARVETTATQTISGLASIYKTTTQTISAVGRVQQAAVVQNQSAVSRIQVCNVFRQAAVSNLRATTSCLAQGIARIERVGLATTIQGTSRIQIAVIQVTTVGKSRIQRSTPQTATGQSRIRISTAQTQSAISRIQIPGIKKTQSAISRVEVVVLRTQTGVSRLKNTASQSQQGVSRIRISSGASQSEISRIGHAGVARTLSGTSRIQHTVTSAQVGTATVRQQALVQQHGASRLQTTASATITAISRLQRAGETKHLIGRSLLQITSIRPRTGVARIRRTYQTVVQNAVSRISRVRTNSITSVSRVQTTVTCTQRSVSSIAITHTSSITSIARVQPQRRVTISGCSRLQTAKIEALIYGRATIKQSRFVQVVKGTARIINQPQPTRGFVAPLHPTVFVAPKPSELLNITAMALPTVKQYPTDQSSFTVNWQKRFFSYYNDGDAISSVEWIVSDGLTLSDQTNTTALATAWLTGGTVGQTYNVTCRMTSSKGRIKDFDFEVEVIDG